MSRLGQACLALTLAVLPVGCGGDGPNGPPAAGVVRFDLETQHADDGALVVVVSGGPVDSIAGPAGLRVYTSAATDGGMSVLVTGAIVAGPLLTVHVPDGRKSSAYTSVVTQVAARSTYELRAPADYRLTRR